jgi:hypothetical protein
VSNKKLRKAAFFRPLEKAILSNTRSLIQFYSIFFLPIAHICKQGSTRRIESSHSSGYVQFYLLTYNILKFVEIQPTFRRNMSPPSPGSKNKLSKKSAWKQKASLHRPSRWRAIISCDTSLTFNGLQGVVLSSGRRVYNTSTVALLVVRGDKREPSCRGYNWATPFLGDINTGTWPSKLG